MRFLALGSFCFAWLGSWLVSALAWLGVALAFEIVPFFLSGSARFLGLALGSVVVAKRNGLFL